MKIKLLSFVICLVFPFSIISMIPVYANPVVPNGTYGAYGHGTLVSVGDNKWTHVGVDILANCGSPIYAFADGKVVDVINAPSDKDFAKKDTSGQIIPNTRLGYMVIIEHPSNLLGKIFYTLYLHLQDPPLVNINASVIGGKSIIGSVGKTGAANNVCHLHVEIRYFKNRYYYKWGNIYGPGDQRNSSDFKNNWGPPKILFEKYPKGINLASTPSQTIDKTKLKTELEKWERLISQIQFEDISKRINIIARTWRVVTDKATGVKLNEEYQKLYSLAKNYLDKARSSINESRTHFERGELDQAKSDLGEAQKNLKIAQGNYQTAIQVLQGQLEAGQILAKGLQQASDVALTGLAALVPGAQQVVDKFLLVRDFVADSAMEGIDQASKEAIVKIAVSKVFNEFLPEGKSVKGLGDIDLSTLSKRLKEDPNFRRRIENEISKAISQYIAEDKASQITQRFTDQFAKFLQPLAIAQTQKQPTVSQFSSTVVNAYNSSGGSSVFGANLPSNYTTPNGVASTNTSYKAVELAQGGIYEYSRGVFVVYGAIYTKYRAIGGPRHYLGLPITNEGDAAKSPQGTTGRFSQFERGTINWLKEKNLTYLVQGAIFQKYASLGYSGSKLGFPLSDEYSYQGSARSDFEGGSITWTSQTGAQVAYKAVSAAACIDGAQFVADVTVPDNTGMQPAQKFTKIWRLKNTGSCSWVGGYSLVFVGGTQMGATGSVSVINTPVNGTADISVPMVAPSSSGTYQGYWQMKNAKGQAFGPQIWVKINVSTTQFQKCPGGEEYTQSPHPNNVFTQNYRGYCTWYVADRWLHAGNIILPSTGNAVRWWEDAKSKFLTGSKPERGSIIVFGSTGNNPAGHVAYVESVSGSVFTIAQMNAGGNIDRDLKTDCFNKVTRDTLQITQTSYKGMPILGFIYPQPLSQQPTCTDGGQFVSDVTIPDSTTLQPNQTFKKTWRLRNTGSCPWSGYSLVFVGGSQMGAPSSVSVPSIPRNATGDISVSMVAPSSPGSYQGNWQMRNAKDQVFGPQIWVKINVASGISANLAPNLPTNLFQFKADGVTGMAAGATTNQNTVVLKGGVSDPNNDTVKLQIELRRLDEYGGQFTGTPTQESTFVSSGSTATITVSGLINGNYHWRARGVDSKGATSNWLSAGGNPDSAADFIVSAGSAQPSTPTITAPGSGSEPGQMINTLTPTLQWNAVSGAEYYALAISKYPYGSGSIIYNPQRVYGTSSIVPSGVLEYGQKYRWNMQALISGSLSPISNTLYFQTPATVSTTTPNPQIVSISPTQVQAGQFTLTINGSNFDSGAIDQFFTPSGQLMGSGAQSGGLISRNSNQIVVRENLTGAPAGTYSVRVKNSDGKLSGSINIIVSTAAPSVQPGPSISSISPTQIQAGQFTLTINGSGFDSGAVDQFYTPSGQYMGSGALSGGLVSRYSNQIVVRENLTGAPAGTYTIRVKNSDGKLSSPINISVSAAVAPTPAPQVVSARIDGYSPADPNSPIRVQIGGSTVLSVRFTNTGNTAWRFIAGASVWDSAGRVVGDYSSTLSAPLQPALQTSVSFNHIVRNAGEYWVQFGVWKQTPFVGENLLEKKPSPAQRVIIGR